MYWKDLLLHCTVIESTIVSFYALSRSDSDFEHEYLWLSPKHIGKGYGPKLFNDAISQVADKGGDALKVCSDPKDEDFYLKKGAKRMKRCHLNLLEEHCRF